MKGLKNCCPLKHGKKYYAFILQIPLKTGSEYHFLHYKMCPPIYLSETVFSFGMVPRKKLKIMYFCGIFNFGKTENSLESVNYVP